MAQQRGGTGTLVYLHLQALVDEVSQLGGQLLSVFDLRLKCWGFYAFFRVQFDYSLLY